MKLLTNDYGSFSAKSALKGLKKCICVSTSKTRVKSPFPDNTDSDDDQESDWLLGTRLNSLPEDVLLAILACFPDKQRAVHLRVVCKSWRDLFNSAVHCITIHSNLGLLPQNPSAFPNLRHLCISQTNSTAAKAAVRLLGVPNCQELTMLEISNTWMQEPPADLHRLTNLKTLSITNCKMKTLAAADLHMLPQLEILDLSSNNLSELPATIGSLGRSLRKLNVSENNLSYLPEGLGGLVNLQSLRAANNTLVELPDSLVDMTTLTTLDLSLNRLKALPERLTALTALKQLGLFAGFSHSIRNEGSDTIRVLADMTLHLPHMHLHAEEIVLSLVRMRRKQLAMAAAVERARAGSPGSDYDGDDGPDSLPPDQLSP